MTQPTAAHLYGAHLGRLQRAFENMFNQISEGFKVGYAPPRSLTPEQIERKRQIAHLARIESERQAGLRFVRNLIAQERRELGLK